MEKPNEFEPNSNKEKESVGWEPNKYAQLMEKEEKDSTENSKFHHKKTLKEKQGFICPMNKNHKLKSNEKLIKHIQRCKECKTVKIFYQCGYHESHYFETKELRDQHHKICDLRNFEDFIPNEMVNDGYDPKARKYRPSEDQRQWFYRNKKRFEIEQKLIKEQKDKLRIHAANPDEDRVNIYEKNALGYAHLPFVTIMLEATNRYKFAKLPKKTLEEIQKLQKSKREASFQ